MKVNKTNYQKKYRRCLRKVSDERLQTLLKSNQKHLKNCSIEDQEIITIEIEQLNAEIADRKQGKQTKLGESKCNTSKTQSNTTKTS